MRRAGVRIKYAESHEDYLFNLGHARLVTWQYPRSERSLTLIRSEYYRIAHTPRERLQASRSALGARTERELRDLEDRLARDLRKWISQQRRDGALAQAHNRGLTPLEAHHETGIPLRTAERFYYLRREAISMQTAELITDLADDIRAARASLEGAADRVLELGRRFPNDRRVQAAVEDFIDVALRDHDIRDM